VPVSQIRQMLDAALTRAGVPLPKPSASQAAASDDKPADK